MSREVLLSSSQGPTPPSSPIEERQLSAIGTPREVSISDTELALLKLVERFFATAKVVTSEFEAQGAPDSKHASPTTNSHVGRASKLEYKLVDEVWDDNAGRYSIVESTKSISDELDQYVFVVRNRIDKGSSEVTTFLDIKSPILRDNLREVCRDIHSVSLADSTPSIEQNVLFHVRGDLKSRRDRSALGSEDSTDKHLSLFVSYIEDAFRSTDERLSVLLEKKEITYDLLWALFKPNAEVFSTCPGTGAPRCFLYNHCQEQEDMSGSKFMYLQTRYLASDGRVLGEVITGAKIPYFRGPNRIEYLPAYPLQYHAEGDEMRSRLVECGRKFVSLMGVHHQYHRGKAFDIDDEGEIVSRHVEGKIIVDTVSFQESKPNYPCPRVQKVRPKYHTFGRCDSIKLVDIDPTQLEEDDLLVCSPTLLGFCLQNKAFLEFAVANITDIEWSQASFDDVKLPHIMKKPIVALMEAYLKRSLADGFKDLVQGKGLGVNFLLYGPPGVGKTLTAETLAETYRVPLYTVAAGQIGVDHVKVEKFLEAIFKLANRWKAVLLLDEADVFLAERTNEPNQNALVSVFLRELEYYNGILFLTTNRYASLGRDARIAVWRFFLEQAETKRGHHACPKNVISDVARSNLNGREIRNAVFIARAMAEHDNTVVNEVHLKDSVAMRGQFLEDGMHGNQRTVYLVMVAQAGIQGGHTLWAN